MRPFTPTPRTEARSYRFCFSSTLRSGHLSFACLFICPCLCEWHLSPRVCCLNCAHLNHTQVQELHVGMHWVHLMSTQRKHYQIMPHPQIKQKQKTNPSGEQHFSDPEGFMDDKRLKVPHSRRKTFFSFQTKFILLLLNYGTDIFWVFFLFFPFFILTGQQNDVPFNMPMSLISEPGKPLCFTCVNLLALQQQSVVNLVPNSIETCHSLLQ